MTSNSARIVILDEDRIMLQSLSQFLRREGYEVRTTDRPEQATALLESGQTELLLADINMPGIKRSEFLRELRRADAGHVNVRQQQFRRAGLEQRDRALRRVGRPHLVPLPPEEL